MSLLFVIVTSTHFVRITFMPLKIIGQTEIEWKRERQWTDRNNDTDRETLGISPSCW